MEVLGSTRMSMDFRQGMGMVSLTSQGRDRSRAKIGGWEDDSDRAEREILEVLCSGLGFKIDVQPSFGSSVCRSVRL